MISLLKEEGFSVAVIHFPLNKERRFFNVQFKIIIKLINNVKNIYKFVTDSPITYTVHSV